MIETLLIKLPEVFVGMMEKVAEVAVVVTTCAIGLAWAVGSFGAWAWANAGACWGLLGITLRYLY
ncbi:hypothetical protein F5Y19DRAFT_27418 [Xylariaceae sp. FL1651]|nr:hypothetical protein F5Y19DRAFT_27418 [Xylariaceae sp. FL1651]